MTNGAAMTWLGKDAFVDLLRFNMKCDRCQRLYGTPGDCDEKACLKFWQEWMRQPFEFDNFMKLMRR